MGDRRMSFTLRVVFEGVCAFVPDIPIFDQNEVGDWIAAQPNSMTVLLPDLREPAEASYSTPQKRVFRHSHFPVLEFDNDLLDVAKSTRSVHHLRKVGGTTRGYCLLDKEEIFLPSAGGFSVDHTIPADHKVPSKKDMESLWWVPRLRAISTNQGYWKVQKTKNPSPNVDLPKAIVAALKLAHGALRVIDFNQDATGKLQNWRFALPLKSGPGAWNRPIGTALALDLNVSTPEVAIELQVRKEGGVEARTRLVFCPAVPQAVVTLRVLNVEIEKLFFPAGSFAVEGSPDPDFEAFYNLTVDPTPGPVPDLGAGQVGDETKPCAPKLAQGFGS